MVIGYSEQTLWLAICKQIADAKSEMEWLQHYVVRNEVECVEDCIRNIMDSCTAIMENIEHLKGEEL